MLHFKCIEEGGMWAVTCKQEKYCKAVKYFINLYEFFVGGEILILESGFSLLHLWAILALINHCKLVLNDFSVIKLV